MQLIAPEDEKELIEIEFALQEQRLARYMPAAGHEKAVAFKYYIWNCSISQEFYISLHFSEILCRNAINKALIFRLGENWFEDRTFRGLLSTRFLSELDQAIKDEQAQHGPSMNAHHIVSALTFGFWEHLTTKRFKRLLWPRGITHNFPNAPIGKNHLDLRELIESVRRWRNRIAHHQAIFDKGPMRKHQDVLDLINWTCQTTGAWVTANSQVPKIISARPSN